MVQWTLFDDENIVALKDWTSVVRRCVELCMIPTVLFYQKYASIPYSQRGASSYLSNNSLNMKLDQYDMQSL